MKHDFAQEYGKWVKYWRIVNLDPTNALTYILNSATNISENLPPAMQAENYEWLSYIEIDPNGTTGIGFLEVQLVKTDDARQTVKPNAQFGAQKIKGTLGVTGL